MISKKKSGKRQAANNFIFDNCQYLPQHGQETMSAVGSSSRAIRQQRKQLVVVGKTKTSPTPPSTQKTNKPKRPRSQSKSKRRKYFICKGNNSILIMRSFKTRSGWSPAKGPEEADFIWSQYSKKVFFDFSHTRSKPRSINHLTGNACLVTKNGLYNSLRKYHEKNSTDLWRSVPVTFHLKSGVDNAEKQRFLKAAATDHTSTTDSVENTTPSPKYWIVKPASATNRGVGIRVYDNVEEVFKLVNKHSVSKQEHQEENENENDKEKTTTTTTDGQTKDKKLTKKKKTKGHREWVIQRYIHNPLLYKGRKFDIRVFVLLVTRSNGKRTECYVFNDGYLRTSSKKFTLDPNKLSDLMMHLTNDGIQCKGGADQYGKHEEGNKLSYETFDTYLTKTSPEKRGAMTNTILPRIKELVHESIDATHRNLNSKNRSHCFELLGYDFMVDDELKTYLIEINSNPCLEDWSCPLLRDMLPVLLDKVLTKVTGTASASTTSTHRLEKNDREREALAQKARAKYTVMDANVAREFELVGKWVSIV